LFHDIATRHVPDEQKGSRPVGKIQVRAIPLLHESPEDVSQVWRAYGEFCDTVDGEQSRWIKALPFPSRTGNSKQSVHEPRHR